MTNFQYLKWIGVGLAGLVILWLGVELDSVAHKASVARDVQQADSIKIQSIEWKAEAKVHDAQAQTDQSQVNATDTENARLRAELARIVKKHENSTPSAAQVQPIGPTEPDLRPVVEAQRNLIAGLDESLKQRDALINSLTVARDSWKRSAEASQAEAVQVRAALAAQQGVAGAQRWLGRVEGLAVGLSVGYVGGRLK